LAAGGAWTSESAEAVRFEDIVSLLRAASQLKETQLEEVLMFGETPSQYDVIMPIFPGSPPRLEP
jgi:hypothetical protein